MAGGVKVEGLNRTIRDLQDLGLEVTDLKEVFSEIAREAAESAARHAPRRTGRLKASIRGNKAKNKAVVTAGKKAVPYAGPINYGWRAAGIRASGFMQKADKEMEDRAYRMLEDGLDRKINEKGFQ